MARQLTGLRAGTACKNSREAWHSVGNFFQVLASFLAANAGTLQHIDIQVIARQHMEQASTKNDAAAGTNERTNQLDAGLAVLLQPGSD